MKWGMNAATTGKGFEEFPHPIAQIVERLASQIDNFADGLLLTAASVAHGASDGSERAVWFWRETERLAQELRHQLNKAQTNWEHHAVEDGWYDLPGVEVAFTRLRRSTDRAALFLGRAEVLLTTMGYSPESTIDEE